MIASLVLCAVLHASPVEAPVPVEFVAEADDPVGADAFTDALVARLPPDRVLDGWRVRVVAEADGAYLLEVLPPDAEVLRRRVRMADPDAARRTLALLAAFALEYGAFPEPTQGVEEVAPAPAPAPEPAPAPAPAPAQEPAPAVEPTVRVVGHVGGGIAIATPTDVDPNATAGGAAAFDLGLRIRRWAWTGMEVAWSGHPDASVFAHRLAAGVFFGALPRVGPVLLGARIGFVGGMLDGRAHGDTARRGYVAGTLALGVDWIPRRGRGLLVGLWPTLEVATRTSSFATPTEQLGFGHARPGVLLTLGWSSPEP